MLQIDHIYEFLYQEIFKDFEFWHLFNGVPKTDNIIFSDAAVFTPNPDVERKIFFYDQEPLLPSISEEYIKMFKCPVGYTIEEWWQLTLHGNAPYGWRCYPTDLDMHLKNQANPNRLYKEPHVLVTSEKSSQFECYQTNYNLKGLYYFFHGFAASDWYRGFHALNYNKSIVKQYKHDFISFNRIITNDRSYRIYFVSQLKAQGLLEHGLVSFGVTDNLFDDWRNEVADPNTKLSEHARQHAKLHLTDISRLVIDHAELPGSASANILRNINGYFPTGYAPINVDAFWHIVTETVFYYDKLHLTEKIFKPIVSKQPFMLLAAPGNLAYLKSYGFKTFDSVIDESYDSIQDNDARIESVVRQLTWYCNLSNKEKNDVIRAIEPIVSHNFHHFYNDFKHIIAKEFLDNIKQLYREINFSDNNIDYKSIYYLLTH
jgi:hypothetical protein